MRAKQRLYLTADRSRVVPEGDPAAASLFACQGQEIADHIARKMGILSDLDAKVVTGPTNDKAVRGPRDQMRQRITETK